MLALSVCVCICRAVSSYLGDGSRGHFDTLLKQHAQYAVLLLQVEHTGPQLHTLLFEVLETNTKWTDDGD